MISALSFNLFSIFIINAPGFFRNIKLKIIGGVIHRAGVSRRRRVPRGRSGHSPRRSAGTAIIRTGKPDRFAQARCQSRKISFEEFGRAGSANDRIWTANGQRFARRPAKAALKSAVLPLIQRGKPFAHSAAKNRTSRTIDKNRRKKPAARTNCAPRAASIRPRV
jgi:hypothetical protein